MSLTSPDLASVITNDRWKIQIFTGDNENSKKTLINFKREYKEIDASIAAKADFENLYDKPQEDKKKVRVAGAFTVESLSPHRILAVD